MNSRSDSFHVLYRPDDVQNILSGKLALRYAGREAEALKAIAQSAIKRSLAQFQQVRSFKNVQVVSRA